MPRVKVKIPIEDKRSIEPSVDSVSDQESSQTSPAQSNTQLHEVPPSSPITSAPHQSFQTYPRRSNKLPYIVLGCIFVILLIVVINLFNDKNQLKTEVDKLSNSNNTSQGQTHAMKYQEKIGKIVELPTNLTPSLIPVTDAKKLAAENSFFKNAQNDDVVLLYVLQDKSVRAILYRPSTHKVIEATSSATIGSSNDSLNSQNPVNPSTQ